MLKEETICKFQQGKDKLHLLKLTTHEKSETQVLELYHCPKGWYYKKANGEIQKVIYEEDIEKFAKVCQLTKKSDVYYYLEENKKIQYTYIYYQIRLNRKRIKTSKFEYEMRKLFAVMAQNMILQLKIY